MSELVSGVYDALTPNFSVLELLQKESMGENEEIFIIHRCQQNGEERVSRVDS